ncbi:hypothetical protein M413DRAFT_408373 [Hebeloma cylindrosporum]|uniref:Uncharacterized protein n=1 Tax=Hebeloma cylindrosporum TaxID=76867 RepID=A0A0C3CFX1_HEBCY|nr:hypothetical protein M413DRAFT_408373 [Hebeloma cylindrosporum h7]
MSEIEEIYLQCWHWDGLSVPKEFALLPKTLASLAIVLLKYCSLEQRCFCRIEDFGKDFGKDNIMEEVLSLLDNREDIIPLRLQALQNDGEAMIDLSLRFLTGLDVPFDANSAMRLLIKVVEGRHEDNVRAHAASLACWIAFYDWPGAPEVFQNWSHLGPKMANFHPSVSRQREMPVRNLWPSSTISAPNKDGWWEINVYVLAVGNARETKSALSSALGHARAHENPFIVIEVVKRLIGYNIGFIVFSRYRMMEQEISSQILRVLFPRRTVPTLASTSSINAGSRVVIRCGCTNRGNKFPSLTIIMPDSESSDSFTESSKTNLLAKYKNRCATCLMEFPESGAHFVHILDAEDVGENRFFQLSLEILKSRAVTDLHPTQLDEGVKLGLIEEGYLCSSDDNVMNVNPSAREPSECWTCDLAFFKPRYIVLSPAKEVLLWYRNYLMETCQDVTKRKPLYQISKMLSQGFDFAPPGTSPGDPNVARIFDVTSLPSSPLPISLGQIPLYPSDPQFTHRRLWRLPTAFPVTLTALFSTIRNIVNTQGEELQLARDIPVLLESPLLGLSV